jgi:hypothetical protein
MAYARGESVTHIFIDVEGNQLISMDMEKRYTIIKTTFVPYSGSRSNGFSSPMYVNGQFFHVVAPDITIKEE